MAFLCLSCRKSGHKTVECPSKDSDDQASSVPSLVSTSLHQGGDLCERCKELKIIDLLLDGDITDESMPWGPLGYAFYVSWVEEERRGNGKFTPRMADAMHNSQRTRNLGPFPDIVFLDSCPLCRLIFSIFPTGDYGTGPNTDYFLKPARTYNLLGKGLSLGSVDEAAKKRYSVSITVCSERQVVLNNFRFHGLQEAGLSLSEHSFALSSNNPIAKEQGLPARVRDEAFKPEIVQAWLHQCESEHPGCKALAPWSDELLTTRMIDVGSRTIVDCPPGCIYMALSYVWGNVVPEEGALRKGTLPPTIEDAMIVTEALGIRYLWVDALCIDQRPSPRKMQQLGIMDRIYIGAYATIVALEGDDSNAGLRGVRARNLRQP
jgi:hypothetical protein